MGGVYVLMEVDIPTLIAAASTWKSWMLRNISAAADRLENSRSTAQSLFARPHFSVDAVLADGDVAKALKANRVEKVEDKTVGGMR